MGQEKLAQCRLASLGDGMHGDGNGLYLRVRGSSRSWIFRYRKDGKLHDIGLGSAKTVTLAKARKTAMGMKVRMAEGRLQDLLGNRKRPDAETFGFLAPKALDNYVRVRKIGKSRVTAIKGCLKHCGAIDPLRVDKITRKDVLGVVSPIWAENNPRARHTLWVINMVMSYAKATGLVSGELPSQWKGNLDAFLSSPYKEHKTRHHAALPLADAPRVFQALLNDGDTPCLAVAFCMATALRSFEFQTLLWEDVDFENAVATVRRTKGKDEPFRVPLAPQVISLLQGMERTSARVFNTTQYYISKAAAQYAPGATVHGMRSVFSMWCAESGVDPYVREKCLAHTVDKAVAAAYQRSDLLDRRRPVMAAWVSYLLSPSSRP